MIKMIKFGSVSELKAVVKAADDCDIKYVVYDNQCVGSCSDMEVFKTMFRAGFGISEMQDGEYGHTIVTFKKN